MPDVHITMGGLDHKIADIRQRVAIAFTARSPIDRMIDAKKSRGWTDLPVFSDESGDYTTRYAGVQLVRTTRWHDQALVDEIGGDMADPDQDPRGAVEMDPLWLLLDTTPEGRGVDWHPQLTY